MIDPILITGCARSGTSLVAGSFYHSGAFGGAMSGPTPFNKKGMFENSVIRDHMVKPYLSNIGVDPLGQNPLPNTYDLPIPPWWSDHIEQIFINQGYKEGSWFYKGAKMCLMWPVWRVAYPQAKWIIVRRPDQDIINSCLRTPFMRAYKNAEGWERWVTHHKQCFQEMKDAKANVIEIWSNRVVAGDFLELRSAIEACGLTFNEKAIKDFVSPELYRG